MPALADTAIEVLGHEASWELHQRLGERLAAAEGEAVEPPVSELLPTRRQPPGAWQGRPAPAPTNDAV